MLQKSLVTVAKNATATLKKLHSDTKSSLKSLGEIYEKNHWQ